MSTKLIFFTCLTCLFLFISGPPWDCNFVNPCTLNGVDLSANFVFFRGSANNVYVACSKFSRANNHGCQYKLCPAGAFSGQDFDTGDTEFEICGWNYLQMVYREQYSLDGLRKYSALCFSRLVAPLWNYCWHYVINRKALSLWLALEKSLVIVTSSGEKKAELIYAILKKNWTYSLNNVKCYRGVNLNDSVGEFDSSLLYMDR